MVQNIPAPKPRELLPPLLACLPAASFSPKPPPAVLPLLTPILRQRVHMLTSGPSSDSWLLLLSWKRDRAAKLPAIVEEMNLEPHPVSGEIELGDVDEVHYQRLDPETLHARLELSEYGLLPIYLWCMGDEQGAGTGWMLTELRSLEDKDDGSQWYNSMEEAEKHKAAGADLKGGATNGDNALQQPAEGEDDEEDDDAYWAAYDNTPIPGRTPAKRSPAPPPLRSGASVQPPSTTELEYFSRYMSEVQPAADPYDPSEDVVAPGESTLDHHGREIVDSDTPQATLRATANGDSYLPDQDKADPMNLVISVPDTPVHPRPLSPSSAGSVENLERQAESQSQAEVGIKQHISTDIKSLYRLARSAGIEREEFERIVKTELDLLSFMDAN